MRYLTTLLLVGSAFLQSGGQTVNIPIQNSDFQAPGPVNSSDSCGTYSYTTPGWSGAVLTFTPANPNPCHISLPADGTQVALGGYSNPFFQELGVSPSQIQALPNLGPGYWTDGIYVLSFDIAEYPAGYPGQYDVELSFGTQQLCESYGWSTHAITHVTMICPGPTHLIEESEPGGGPGQGTNNFVVTFTLSGWQSWVKDVSLTFTPQ